MPGCNVAEVFETTEGIFDKVTIFVTALVIAFFGSIVTESISPTQRQKTGVMSGKGMRRISCRNRRF